MANKRDNYGFLPDSDFQYPYTTNKSTYHGVVEVPKLLENDKLKSFRDELNDDYNIQRYSNRYLQEKNAHDTAQNFFIDADGHLHNHSMYDYSNFGTTYPHHTHTHTNFGDSLMPNDYYHHHHHHHHHHHQNLDEDEPENEPKEHEIKIPKDKKENVIMVNIKIDDSPSTTVVKKKPYLSKKKSSKPDNSSRPEPFKGPINKITIKREESKFQTTDMKNYDKMKIKREPEFNTMDTKSINKIKIKREFGDQTYVSNETKDIVQTPVVFDTKSNADTSNLDKEIKSPKERKDELSKNVVDDDDDRPIKPMKEDFFTRVKKFGEDIGDDDKRANSRSSPKPKTFFFKKKTPPDNRKSSLKSVKFDVDEDSIKSGNSFLNSPVNLNATRKPVKFDSVYKYENTQFEPEPQPIKSPVKRQQKPQNQSAFVEPYEPIITPQQIPPVYQQPIYIQPVIQPIQMPMAAPQPQVIYVQPTPVNGVLPLASDSFQMLNAQTPVVPQPNIINITRIQEPTIMQPPEELNYEIIKRKNPIKTIVHHYFKKPVVNKIRKPKVK